MVGSLKIWSEPKSKFLGNPHYIILALLVEENGSEAGSICCCGFCHSTSYLTTLLITESTNIGQGDVTLHHHGNYAKPYQAKLVTRLVFLYSSSSLVVMTIMYLKQSFLLSEQTDRKYLEATVNLENCPNNDRKYKHTSHYLLFQCLNGFYFEIHFQDLYQRLKDY